MLYKFIHADGYEVVIKDIDSFIGYVNTNAINEKTRIYDEINNKGMFAYEVKEFKEIFDTMRKNGWTLYVVPKAVESSSVITNYGLKDAKNDDDDDRLIINYETKNNRREEQLVKKDVNVLTKWTTMPVRLSNNAKMFFGAAATALVFLSFIINIVTTKTLSENHMVLNEIAKRLSINLLIALVVTFIVSKIFFIKKKFVAYLFFSILMFSISVFQYVDSIEKERVNKKETTYQYNYQDNILEEVYKSGTKE